MKAIFLKLMFNILGICKTFTMKYLFFPERMKVVANLHDQEEYVLQIGHLN